MEKQGTYNEQGEKWCWKCRAYHHPSGFGKSRATKDGLGYVCTAQARIANQANADRRKLAEVDNDRGGVATHQAIQSLRLSRPDLKLANPYEYKRPDAWDIHLQSK